MFFTPVVRRAAVNPSWRLLDRNFERFLDEATAAGAARPSAKACQFEQDDASFTLSLDLPGLGKEHLAIHIEGAVVRIDSLADAPRSFKAAYELPQEIDSAASQASMAHGVLTLKLAKKLPVSNVSALTIN